MEIGLIRVDSRLIHGQVITKWLNYSKANVIVVVDDELSKDSFMSEIYKASAPNGIIVEILSIDDFMKNTGTHKYSNKRLLILLNFRKGLIQGCQEKSENLALKIRF